MAFCLQSGYSMPARQFFNRLEAQIVAGVFVFSARVPETNN
jgi:hypothetical protein